MTHDEVIEYLIKQGANENSRIGKTEKVPVKLLTFSIPEEEPDIHFLLYFETMNCYTEQYLKLLMQIMNFAEFGLKRVHKGSPQYRQIMCELSGCGRLKPLFEESRKAGINPSEITEYVLKRVMRSDFKYPLYVITGKQRCSLNPDIINGREIILPRRSFMEQDELNAIDLDVKLNVFDSDSRRN